MLAHAAYARLGDCGPPTRFRTPCPTTSPHSLPEDFLTARQQRGQRLVPPPELGRHGTDAPPRGSKCATGQGPLGLEGNAGATPPSSGQRRKVRGLESTRLRFGSSPCAAPDLRRCGNICPAASKDPSWARSADRGTFPRVGTEPIHAVRCPPVQHPTVKIGSLHYYPGAELGTTGQCTPSPPQKLCTQLSTRH